MTGETPMRPRLRRLLPRAARPAPRAEGHWRLEARCPRSFAIEPAGGGLLDGPQDDDVVSSRPASRAMAR
jgi:hypothetical protein